MKKRFGVGIILLIGVVLVLSVLAARLPTNGQDSGSWGTILNDFLNAAHDTGGGIKGGAVGSGALADAGILAADINQSAVNGTHIVDLTIGAIDLADDSVNATALSAVNRLIFGICNINLPAMAAGGINNTATASAGLPMRPGSNCTVSGATVGDALIVTPGVNGSAWPGNISLIGANVSTGGNLTLTFQNIGTSNALGGGVLNNATFNFIVYANGTA